MRPATTVLPALLFEMEPLITTGATVLIVSTRLAVVLSSESKTLPASVVAPVFATVKVRLPPEFVNTPFIVRLFVPPMADEAVSVTELAKVRAPLPAISVPPLSARFPVPKVVSVPIIVVPAVSVEPPVHVPAAPFKTRVPAPAFVSVLVPPASVTPPPSVKVFAFTVKVRFAPLTVTMPVPKFKLVVPVNVGLPPLMVRALLLALEIEPPLVLSNVPLPLTVKAPVPMAVAVLMLMVLPVFNVVPPA